MNVEAHTRVSYMCCTVCVSPAPSAHGVWAIVPKGMRACVHSRAWRQDVATAQKRPDRILGILARAQKVRSPLLSSSSSSTDGVVDSRDCCHVGTKFSIGRADNVMTRVTSHEAVL